MSSDYKSESALREFRRGHVVVLHQSSNHNFQLTLLPWCENGHWPLVRYLVVHPECLLQFKLERVFVFVYQKPKREEERCTEWRKQNCCICRYFDRRCPTECKEGKAWPGTQGDLTSRYLALRVTNSSNSSWPDLLKSQISSKLSSPKCL